MKAIKVFEKGNSDVLKLVVADKPKLKEGWSLVKVKGFGINRSEIFTRKGYSPSVKFPRILGIECVGIVEETTDKDNLPVGSKLISIMGEMGRNYDGSYAEYVLLPNSQIYKVETDLDWSNFASIPETFYTAFGSFENLMVKETDTVLVRGATSGVGIAFSKLLKAKYPNIQLFGSTRNTQKIDKLKKYGFDEVILDINGRLDTEKKFDKILELIGPVVIKDSIKHLNESGIICNTGQLGEKWYLESFDPIMQLKENVYLTAFYSGNVSETKIKELFDYIKKYKIYIEPERVFKLEEIADAHDYLENSDSFGKVVVVND